MQKPCDKTGKLLLQWDIVWLQTALPVDKGGMNYFGIVVSLTPLDYRIAIDSQLYEFSPEEVKYLGHYTD